MGRLKVKTNFKKTQDAIRQLRDKSISLNQSYVSIGVHSDAGNYEGTDTSVVTVAFANEFGTKDIPERSFLRQTFIGERDRINKVRDQAIENVLKKGWSVEKALDMIGFNIVLMIQNRMRQGIMPPNAPDYLKQKQKKKQGSTPLIRLGSEKLIRSITHRVVVK